MIDLLLDLPEQARPVPLWVPALAPSSPHVKVPPLESGLVPARIPPSLALSQMAPGGGG